MDLTTDQQTEANANSYSPAFFILIDFPSGKKAFSTLPFNHTDGPDTYLPATISDAEGVSVSSSRSSEEITIQLPGSDTGLLADIETNYHFSKVLLKTAFLDKTMRPIGPLITYARPYLSQCQLVVSEKNTVINLKLESYTLVLLRTRRVTATNADQQHRRPGDLGLSLIHQVEGAADDWGGYNVRGTRRAPRRNRTGGRRG